MPAKMRQVERRFERWRHARELAADPASWMPWKYRDTVAAARIL
jgi:hypothetical protein